MITLPVRSSNIQQISYDPKEQILTVWFHSGAVYMYSDVPMDLFQEMMKADSIGKFFHSRIRSEFKFQRVDDPASRKTEPARNADQSNQNNQEQQ